MTASMLKAHIAKALEKIGLTGNTSANESQDPFDAVLHEYNVANTIRGIAEKRYDLAKKAVIANLSSAQTMKLEDTIKQVERANISDDIAFDGGKNHDLSAQVKIGASFMNTNKLRVKLLKTMPTEAIAELFDECMDRRVPSVTYRVSENE